VAKGQRENGAWQAQFGADVGSPVTYGTCLATVQARSILLKADARKYQTAIAKADDWLSKAPVARVLDAAEVLLWLTDAEAKAKADQRATGFIPADRRRECLKTIRKGRSKDGGWGPYVNSPPEAFDTAVVLLALSRQPDDKELKEMLKRGRAYLIAN